MKKGIQPYGQVRKKSGHHKFAFSVKFKCLIGTSFMKLMTRTFGIGPLMDHESKTSIFFIYFGIWVCYIFCVFDIRLSMRIVPLVTLFFLIYVFLRYHFVRLFPKTNENFRLLYDTKGRFRLHSIRDEEAKFKLCKVRSIQFGKKMFLTSTPTTDGLSATQTKISKQMTPSSLTWKPTRLLNSSSLILVML